MNHGKEVYIANHTTLDLGHWKFGVRYTLRLQLGAYLLQTSSDLRVVLASIGSGGGGFALSDNGPPNIVQSHANCLSKNDGWSNIPGGEVNPWQRSEILVEK